MVPRGRRSVLTAILGLALLFAALPGWAAQQRRPAVVSGWEEFWQRVVDWVAERAGSTAVWDKSSSQIDPLGQPQVVPPPADTARPDYSAGIDPNGQH